MGSPTPTVYANGAVSECCREQDNLVLQAQGPKPEMSIRVCKVCERRHYTLKLDPMKIGSAIRPDQTAR